MKKIHMIPAALLIGSLALVSCAPSQPTQNAQTVSSVMTETPTYTSSSRSVESTAGTIAASEEAAMTLLANSSGDPGSDSGGARYSLNSLKVSEQAAANAVLKAMLNDASYQEFADSSYLEITGTPSADGTWGISFGRPSESASVEFSDGSVSFSPVDMTVPATRLPQMGAFYETLTEEQLGMLETGLAVSTLDSSQQEMLLDLVSNSIGLADTETTATAISEIRATLSETYLFETPDGLTLALSGPHVDFEVSHQGSTAKITYRDPSTDSLTAEDRVDTASVAAAPPEVV